jgi:hypothetical protein
MGFCSRGVPLFAAFVARKDAKERQDAKDFFAPLRYFASLRATKKPPEGMASY